MLANITTTSLRFYGSLMLVFFCLLLAMINLASNYRDSLVEMRKSEIKRIVEIGINTIQPIIDRFEAGEITRVEAIFLIRQIVGRMTYKSETMDNYMFMSSYEGIMLVQPLEPELEGSYQWNATDVKGNYYIRDLVNTASGPDGGGFVFYFYPPPGSDNAGQKLSYVRGLQSLGCYIGTGMFFNDINALVRHYLLGPILFVSIAFLVVSVLFVIILRPLARCLQVLVRTFHEISTDPSSPVSIPSGQFSEGSDERKILSGFARMLDMQNQYREQLIQSEKLSTLGILVAGVAHEINNPNQFILTNSELVRRAWEEIEPILNQYREEEGDFFLLGGMYSETGEKVSGYLRGITEGSKRINKIVTDLKSYARTEPREQPLAPVLLNEVVESSVNLCRNLIKNSTNHFSLSLAGENPIVLGSAQRLEQVVINLIQNACHALTDPSQGIAISTAVDDTEGRVRLVVSDQGSGIDKEVMDKIALPFFTTKRTRGGTGLGLSISQRIVEEHKGLISFSSDPGKGTEVTVTLPCADPAESSVLLRTAAPGGG